MSDDETLKEIERARAELKSAIGNNQFISIVVERPDGKFIVSSNCSQEYVMRVLKRLVSYSV